MFKLWKLQNQVSCMYLFQLVLIMACVIICYIVAYSTVQQVYTRASEVLIVLENNKSSNRLQQLTVRNISLILNRSLRQIVNTNYLYQYNEQLDYSYIQAARPCINTYQEQDAYAFNSSVCYGFFGETNVPLSKEDQRILNFTALITMTLLIHEDVGFQYANLEQNKFFARHQGFNISVYDPQIRPWFLQLINYKGHRLTTFTTPYFSLQYQSYVISQSTALRNINGKTVGVMTGSLTLLDLINSTRTNMNITMFDKTGLVYNVGPQNATQIHLDNESYTGFNSQQQDEILQLQPNSQSILLFNSLEQQLVSVNQKQLGTTELFLLFQTNPKYQNCLIQKEIYKIKKSLIGLYLKTTFFFIIIVPLLIGLSIIILIITFRPLNNIQMLMQNSYQQGTFKILKPIRQLKRSSVSQLQILQHSFYRMIQNISHRKCINREAIQMNNIVEYLLQQDQRHFTQPLVKYLNSFIISSEVIPDSIYYNETSD